MYLLSHFDHEHNDSHNLSHPVNEGNLASVDVPLGIHAATTLVPSLAVIDDDDPIEFQGAWCAPVSNANAAAAFGLDDLSPADDSPTGFVDVLDEDLEYDALNEQDREVLSHLTSVEREMFLQVEHDLFPSVSPLRPDRKSVV